MAIYTCRSHSAILYLREPMRQEGLRNIMQAYAQG